MSEVVNIPLKLFYCYSHKDKGFRDALDSHLISLKRQKLIEIWYDGKISPGTDWEGEIDRYLRNADIVLLLISADFLSSDYCYSKEMAQALKRHNAGTVRVIPILLRPVDLEDEPISKLQILPTEAKPVTRWLHPDDAYEDIAKKLRAMVKDLQARRKTLVEEWYDKGGDFYNRKQYEEALEALEVVLRLDPTNYRAYHGKGLILYELMRYEESLEALDETLLLNPSYIYAYGNKGTVLHELERYEEALESYEKALRFDPKNVDFYNNMASTLDWLDRTEEAQQAREKARQLESS